MSLDIGGIELFMGPTESDSPDNLEHTITRFIDSADDALEIAVQELESLPITQAVLRARKRGVRMRVVLERDYLAEPDKHGREFCRATGF